MGPQESDTNERHSLSFSHTHTSLGFPGGSSGKNPLANAGEIKDMGLIPGLGRYSGGGNGNPFQYSCLGSPTDRGAWQTTVQWVTKSLI